ncbi:hypothetical protein ASE38_11175 [Cellulomonas sp. Root930]|nr:hypothetical protein ASE38_11175 [Cellulomonas sp. Root930]
MTDEPGRAPAISRASASAVGAAALFGGLSGYVVLLVATHTLTKAATAEFLAFWSLLFWVMGALNGLQNESTRAVAARAASVGDVRRGARAVPTSLAVGGALCAVLALSSPLWGLHVLGDDWRVLVVMVALAGVAFAGHSALCGALAGRGDWTAYTATVSGEAAARIGLVAVAAVVGAGVVGLEAAAAAAAAAWLLLAAVSRRVRSGTTERADVDAPTFLRHVRATLIASIASSAILVGFPVLLRATSTDVEYEAAAPFVVAISVTRAPLIFPLIAYQGVAIRHFLGRRAEGLRALWPGVRLILLCGAVGAALAALVGPWAMQIMFGEEYDVSSGVLAGLTVAAATLALLVLTGAATLALGSHRAFATGWVLASLVTLAMLLTPLPLEQRSILSLVLGPLVGVVIHVRTIAGAPSDDG